MDFSECLLRHDWSDVGAGLSSRGTDGAVTVTADGGDVAVATGGGCSVATAGNCGETTLGVDVDLQYSAARKPPIAAMTSVAPITNARREGCHTFADSARSFPSDAIAARGGCSIAPVLFSSSRSIERMRRSTSVSKFRPLSMLAALRNEKSCKLSGS